MLRETLRNTLLFIIGIFIMFLCFPKESQAQYYADTLYVDESQISDTDAMLEEANNAMQGLQAEMQRMLNGDFQQQFQQEMNFLMQDFQAMLPQLLDMQQQLMQSFGGMNFAPPSQQPFVTQPAPAQQGMTMDKASQLREIKKLFDEGVLTRAEYDAEKAKILNE